LEGEGFTVDVVHDGLTGLERGHDTGYDAIVLDILLPGMNGYKVCEKLRGDGVWTPILMLTAKDGEYDEAEALDTGADDFLSKPFSFVVLVARLRALGRRGQTVPNEIHAVGDLVLDVGAGECRRGDTPIALTPRELALLTALLRREGDAAPKDDLLREVWGTGFAGDPNIVEVYVGYLRRKIDEPFGRASIATVRGVGYQLVDDRTTT
jgi:two-component system OmpR family response regulator